MPKSSFSLAETGVWKISSAAYGFRSIRIDYSDYPKSLNSRISSLCVFFSIKYRYRDILLKKRKLHLTVSLPKIESEYDQEIPQSQTADNPVAP